jgi:peptide/nickel transport system permease protein
VNTNSSAFNEKARLWRRFCRHKLAVAGLVFIVIMVFCAAFAPLIAPHKPNKIGSDFESPPGKGYVLGTDQIGRDVLSRLIYASRISLVVGIGTMTVTTILGIILGLESGYYGGAVDALIMRIADIFMAFPLLIIIMVVSSVIGPGLDRIIIIMGFLNWPTVARLVRGNVLSIKQMEYIKSAVTLGFKTQRILFLHILPNTLSPVLVQASFGIARAILLESALSFLGMGVNPPTASWGNMLTDAQSLTTLTSKPWLWIPPGLMILLNVLSFNFIGDGLRDSLDPRSIT